MGIGYLTLTLLSTPAAMLAIPRMGAWMQAAVCALYGGALSDADMTSLETFLINKWGIA